MVSEFHQRRVLQLYPALARAVAPVPLCGEKRHHYSPNDVYRNPFWTDQRQSFQLREAHDASSVIAVNAQGVCLHPLRSNGDVMHFDPTMPAQAGDIVLFQHPDGAAPHLFMSKMLVEFGCQYWLAWNEGMFPLGDIRILGVEVRAPSASSTRDSDAGRPSQVEVGHLLRDKA